MTDTTTPDPRGHFHDRGECRALADHHHRLAALAATGSRERADHAELARGWECLRNIGGGHAVRLSRPHPLGHWHEPALPDAALAPLARAVVFAATPADELAACRALAQFLAADFDAAMATPAPASIADPAVAIAACTGVVDVRDLGEDPPDELMAAAIDAVRSGGVASISRIQRVFRIGYNRAARLIEAMEREGIISAPNSRGERHVIATDGAPA